MGACAKRGISLTFLTSSGRFLARVTGEERGNVLLRRTQYRFSDDVVKSARIAGLFLTGKLYNGRWVLERAIRDYPMRLDTERLKRKSLLIRSAIESVRHCTDLEQLRGILRSEEVNIEHNGLQNINRRIWLGYGGDSGLTIDSAEGEGFTVKLKLRRGGR